MTVKKKSSTKTSSAKKATSKKVSVKKGTAKKAVAKKKVKAGVKKIATKKIVKKVLVKKEVSPKKITAKTTKVKSAAQLLVDAAVEGILEVKGRNISILDLRKIHNRVCDYYIICQADSSTQVNAIAGSVEVMVKKRIGERPYHTEGFQNSEWILVDYVTVVVHIFQSHIREFYKLEALWADAEVTKVAFD